MRSRRRTWGARLVAGVGIWVVGCAGAAAAEFVLEGRTLYVPDGFVVERVTGPPLVDRPIVADFDERGRLYVADSSGSNDPVQKQLEERPHRILRLEDTDGDGVFDARTVFADRMMFPEGAMWAGGSLYVSAPPEIWKLTDTNDDGVADRREVWFDGRTLTGCANDLHGPYLGPDGLVYWCKGAFAQQTYERPDGRPPLVTRAAHIFRRGADESGFVEAVMTGGMDNPVDVVFTPGGERVFTTTFLQHPEGGRRDGLIHAIYGGVYGKVHDVLDGHPRTGPDVMPVLEHLGPAAPCGLARYEAEGFGAEYRDNLFACLFNLHQVTRHVLRPDGGTLACRTENFLASPDHDFHPTDVVPDADGSLLVVDTGGWYKLCCPTSQLHKPDVLGAIYRVRRVGAARVDDPRGVRLDWQNLRAGDLARRLDDPRPAVRRRAREALAARGAAAIPALAATVVHAGDRGESPQARENAVWAAGQVDLPEAREVVRRALEDRDATVRQAALNTISRSCDREAVPQLVELLESDSGLNRRVAAEALGRIGDAAVVPSLLRAASRPGDRAIEHALTYALIEIGDVGATAAGLRNDDPRVRRAALVALDQLGGRCLEAGEVAAMLASDDAGLREAASWVLGRHPEWGDALAGLLRARLGRAGLSPEERVELEGQLARFAGSGPIRDLLAEALRDASATPDRRISVLRAMAGSGLKEMPESWVVGLADVLGSGDEATVRQAIATVRALGLPRDRVGEVGARLVAIATTAEAPDSLKVEALAAVPGGLPELQPEIFDTLLEQLDAERPVSARLAAADVLGKAGLTRGQLRTLADRLASAGPLEIDRLLAAFDGADDPEVGMALVGALRESPALPALRVETLGPKLERFGDALVGPSRALFEAIAASRANESARLETLLGSLPEGDVRRGQAVFNGTKAACASCHAIGYLGGKVGPDLTRIGQIRAERDLLESIVFPSASFVRSYEPVTVATRDGRVFSGLLRKDAEDEVVLVIGADHEERLPRAEVEAMQPSAVSVMPAGLDQQLTEQELADLVAFLKACR